MVEAHLRSVSAEMSAPGSKSWNGALKLRWAFAVYHASFWWLKAVETGLVLKEKESLDPWTH